METLIQTILTNESTEAPLKIQVLRSMSEIFRGHRENLEKARTLGLIGILTKFICEEHNSRICRWSCYVLVYMCTTSMVCLKEMMQEAQGRDCDDSLKVLEEHSWKGWPRNYAALIREVLGFKERQDRIDPRLLAGFNPGLIG